MSDAHGSSVDLDQGVRAYPIEAEEALTAWVATRTEGVWTSPAGWWYAAWMHRQAEVSSLQDQIAHLTGYVDGLKRGSDLHEQRRGELEKQVAAQTAVVEAIRGLVKRNAGSPMLPLLIRNALKARLDAADVPAASTRENE
jgi:hypothetical protein